MFEFHFQTVYVRLNTFFLTVDQFVLFYLAVIFIFFENGVTDVALAPLSQRFLMLNPYAVA